MTDPSGVEAGPSRRNVIIAIGAAAVAVAAGSAAALRRSGTGRESSPGSSGSASSGAPTPAGVTTPTSVSPTPQPTPAPSPSLTGPETTSGSPTATVSGPPIGQLFVPATNDVYPDVKQPAGRFVQALAGAPAGGTAVDAVRQALQASRPTNEARTGDGSVAAAMAGQAGFLYSADQPSTAEILNAQLSGLSPGRKPLIAGVMVVCRQRFDDGTSVTRTVDVRLTFRNGTWDVDAIPDAGGVPVRRPRVLPRAAAAVLDDRRIDLPDSARWDIHAGIVDERLLTTMAAMAQRAPYAVTCLRNGHPVHVFDTDRVSNHNVGRAVDVWRWNGAIVASQQPSASSGAHAIVRWLFDKSAVPELGSPWDFDGPVDRSFTNDVHLDHLHVAYDRLVVEATTTAAPQ